MTTQTLLTEWLENYEKEHVKSRTYARYHGLITAHINPAIGEHDIENLSRRDIQDFLSKQKSEGNIRTGGGKLSATSTNLILTVLNLAFEYACDMEIIEQNPCTRIRRSREDARKVEAFTKDEQRKIENEIMNSDDPRLFGILLCLYTGVRIGELLGLEWADVDLQRGFIAINKTVYRDRNESGEWQLVIDKPKTTASDRIIPLPSYISQMMAERKENAKTNYVIENKKGEIVFEASSLVKPSKPYNINSRTLKFLSLKRVDFDNACTYKEFYELLKECMRKYKPKVYAWGRSDIMTIEQSFTINKVKPLDIRKHHINLMQVMKNYYNLKDEMGLFQTYEEMSMMPMEPQQHDAFEDAMLTREIFRMFKEKINYED